MGGAEKDAKRGKKARKLKKLERRRDRYELNIGYLKRASYIQGCIVNALPILAFFYVFILLCIDVCMGNGRELLANKFPPY